jgi:hypothetical protein
MTETPSAFTRSMAELDRWYIALRTPTFRVVRKLPPLTVSPAVRSASGKRKGHAVYWTFPCGLISTAMLADSIRRAPAHHAAHLAALRDGCPSSGPRAYPYTLTFSRKWSEGRTRTLDIMEAVAWLADDLDDRGA